MRQRRVAAVLLGPAALGPSGEFAAAVVIDIVWEGGVGGQGGHELVRRLNGCTSTTVFGTVGRPRGGADRCGWVEATVGISQLGCQNAKRGARQTARLPGSPKHVYPVGWRHLVSRKWWKVQKESANMVSGQFNVKV